MNTYELQQLRTAELIRQAEQARLVREVTRGNRAARRQAEQRTTEAESHSRRPRRHRFLRTA
ncbi:hypothetical protein [Streptomyces sp. NPDC052610]|uniref:hypothetical protein n=1 Tax=Streptomyces sp. NPDC052610 TaxID=3154952 RepID=UPI003424483A